ncbi:MAG: translation initiation factor IF-3 [Dehalococcoidales bacterium]|nr:translation initiation factor IF-3 [Dehalococcoidales bacterium]
MKGIVKKLRINQEIIAGEVRLVGEKGEQLGVMPLRQAQEMAVQRDLDLVEVAPTAVPPVCRFLDYGRYRYEQTKRERESRRSQRVALLREIRFRPRIDDHDFEAKTRSVKKLLKGGDKVKVTVMFRGREVIHADIGLRLLQRMVDSLKEDAVVDRTPLMYGKRMIMILSPLASQKTKTKEKVKEA